jgi:DNA invertase Pin-like site-specific DNA recombinase
MTATRAAVYLRQSLDATGEGLAIERQRADCLKIAADRGWPVVAEFVDNSISASGKRRRPGYDALCAAHAAGEFEAVICYDLDRLTRAPRQLEDWIDAATERGLKLVTANGEADLGTDAGRLFARIKASVARAEIERKAARQRSAAFQRSELGRPPMGVRLTGYTTAGELIEDEAAIVRQVFARFAAGDSLRSLAAWLTESGAPTRHGGRWSPSTVAGMLQNPRYAGHAIYQGQTTGKAGAWPALVEPEVFDQVADRLADPRRKTNRHGTDRKHLGSGLFRCAVCDRRLRAWSANRYRCAETHVNRGQAPINAMVVEAVRGRLGRADLADLLPRGDSGEVARLNAEITRLEGRVRRIEADYDAELIDGRRYKTATEKASAELAAARSARARLTTPGAASGVLAAADPVAAFDAAPLMIRRAVIEALVIVRVGPAPRGRKTFDPWTLATSQWTDDPQTWGQHWEAENLAVMTGE